jgi:hypothetical protein
MNNQLLLSCVTVLHISISAFLFGAAPITQIGYCFSCLGVVQIGSLAQYGPLDSAKHTASENGTFFGSKFKESLSLNLDE